MPEDPLWPRASTLFTPSSEISVCDVALLGIPTTSRAITPNRADQSPRAIREALHRYSTWSTTHQSDLKDLLSAIDFGDVVNPDVDELSVIKRVASLVEHSRRILLGRQSSWPKGRFSTFAGFVEAGESFESAVEREVFEECGVRSQEIHYLGSQPWPFPASIMVAFEIEAENPDVARADGIEIEQVAWFTRKELLDAVSSGEILLPPGISIARRMIENWYGARLLGGEAWR